MKKGEIWLIDIPSATGHEQKGKRPALILALANIDLITVIPLTSNLLASRFNYTFLIKKSLANKLEKDSIALIFQIQSLDKRRLTRKIGELEEENLKKINGIIKNYMKI